MTGHSSGVNWKEALIGRHQEALRAFDRLLRATGRALTDKALLRLY
jgi:hypothetical protein